MDTPGGRECVEVSLHVAFAARAHHRIAVVELEGRATLGDAQAAMYGALAQTPMWVGSHSPSTVAAIFSRSNSLAASSSIAAMRRA